MVLLIITPRILDALNSLPESTRNDPDLEIPAPAALGGPISHAQLITLSRHLRRATGSNAGTETPARTPATSLDSLLRGTTVYVSPPPKQPEPSPEYLALKARLLAAEEASAYRSLLHPLTPEQAQQQPSSAFSSTKPMFGPGFGAGPGAVTEDDDPLTPNLVLNILLSSILSGFSTFWVLSKFRIPDFLSRGFSLNWSLADSSLSGAATSVEQWSTLPPGSITSLPARVFLALGAAFVVAIAEVVIYSSYVRNVNLAREREAKLKEKKTVVGVVKDEKNKVEGQQGSGGTIEAGVETEKAIADGEKDTEEIWGRGANGGMRRRVKERWDGRMDPNSTDLTAEEKEEEQP